MFLFVNAISKCKKIIKKFKPDIVIGVGGYVSAPVIYAANKLGVKCCVHEQNSSFGMTNKFASSFADEWRLLEVGPGKTLCGLWRDSGFGDKAECLPVGTLEQFAALC
jgi:hypothetical protein